MSYTTDSSHSPKNNTGDITTSLIKRVKNNPFHPTATDISWPSNYDAFVVKTNDQQSSVSVIDETHIVAEIDTGNSNALYLEHRPKLGTSISIVGDASAVITTGSTDFTHGILYFDSMPTGEFTVQYLADPDKYYGEYLTQVQDSLHEIERFLGAGGAINEGMKNAEFWLDSSTGSTIARLPNVINTRSINRDIEIKSANGDVTGHDITIGNSEDRVHFNVETFNVFRGTAPGTNMTVNLTDETGDLLYIDGMVNLSPTGTSRNPSFTSNQVSTGLSDSGRDSGAYDALRVYGDMYVAGNTTFLGSVEFLTGTVTSQITVHNSDLQINGDSYLGNDSSDNTWIAGDLTVTGGITQIGVGGENLTVNRNIVLGNTPNISLVDGLDPSYIASVHQYYRPGGPDWGADCINKGRMSILVEDGVETGGYEGSATSTAGSAEKIVDSTFTGAANIYSRNAVGGSGYHYDGRYDDGTWEIFFTSGPHEGQTVPVERFDTGNDTWILSRALDSVTTTSVSYRLQNPYFSNLDVFSAAGTSATVIASATSPIIGDVRGYIKKRTSNYANITTVDNAISYIYMNLDPSTGMLEQEAEFHSNTGGVPSDRSILVGEVTVVSAAVTNKVIYRKSGRYDSGWRYVTTAGTGLEISAGADNTFYHNLGGKIFDYNIAIYYAPNSSGKPNLAAVEQYAPDQQQDSAIASSVTALTRTTMVIRFESQADVSPVGPYWIRVVVKRQ